MSLDPEGIDLKKIANNKKFKYFIETGTGHGGAVEGAIKSEVFDKIISIELNPELVEYCRDKFKDNTNVEIVTGSSDVELPKILEEIDENIDYF
jgi:16S rRNA A1518/A1519 N6-dimethyltransferase RsmA/KsgA/DIM1 with predicted DNA glycosylase/AP lyase activity